MDNNDVFANNSSNVFDDTTIDYVCTCDSYYLMDAWEPEDHTEECELQMSWTFTSGFSTWSNTLKKLIDVQPKKKQQNKKQDKLWHNLDAQYNNQTPLKSASNFQYKPQCNHERNQNPFTLSNETTIYLSAGGAHQSKPRIQRPDLHIMLASSQRPLSVAWYVPWPDYQLPDLSDVQMWSFVDQVVDILEAGEFVETGCMAAHGRTGTFVALLELNACARVGKQLPTRQELIKFVRDNHCPRAIESDVQHWYLDVYRAHLLNEEPPPIPQPKKAHTNKNQSTFDF